MTKTKLFSVTLDDCRVDTFTVGGHGGAGKDTSNTGVRITHLASGAVGRSVDHRQQSRNKQLAWRRMAETPTFKSWCRLMATFYEGGQSIEDQVDESMKLENLKIEVKVDGKWSQVYD